MQKEIVTAAEIAEWVYCPESWRLSRTGHESVNQLAREAGDHHHSRKAAVERVAGGFVALGRVLILVALLAMGLLWWLAQ